MPMLPVWCMAPYMQSPFLSSFPLLSVCPLHRRQRHSSGQRQQARDNEPQRSTVSSSPALSASLAQLLSLFLTRTHTRGMHALLSSLKRDVWVLLCSSPPIKRLRRARDEDERWGSGGRDGLERKREKKERGVKRALAPFSLYKAAGRRAETSSQSCGCTWLCLWALPEPQELYRLSTERERESERRRGEWESGSVRRAKGRRVTGRLSEQAREPEWKRKEKRERGVNEPKCDKTCSSKSRWRGGKRAKTRENMLQCCYKNQAEEEQEFTIKIPLRTFGHGSPQC